MNAAAPTLGLNFEPVPVTFVLADDEFRNIVRALLAAALVCSVLIPLVNVPELSREEAESLPPVLAQLRLEKITPKKPVMPAPPPVNETDMDPVEAEKPPVETGEEPPQSVQQAKEKAKTAGVLAFADSFADLRAAVDINALKETANIQRGAGEAARIDRALLTATRSGRKAAVDIAALSSATGGVALSAAETTVVTAPVNPQAPTGARQVAAIDEAPGRSIEDIRRVFDANKGAIFAIYNRQLRKQPGLLGKLVLELEIQPDGSVSDCQVISSELDSEELLTKLTRRIQLFNFGQEPVAITRINYPIHFLPR